MGNEHHIRVIVAGGGVVGLTLANALEQAGVDYILLERRNEIAPNIGQSIASEPNGARILDQLGILKEWRKHSQAATWWFERDTDGEVLFKTDGLRLGGLARTGYDLQFGERQAYLKTIYSNIKDRSRVLSSKNISTVELSDSGVTVKCDDGSSYDGDILAGADGVRSKVREEMWRLASSTLPELVEHDKNALFAEYKCFFGIASTPPGPKPGDCDFGYDKDRSSLVFAGPNNQSYFFIFEKLDKIYRGADIPRFTKDDAVKFVEKHLSMNIRPGITISDYWETSENFTLACLEEGTFKLWTWGRIACVGDSVHKMTPNIGAGGNAGIESAAALANAVKSIAEKSHGQLPGNELVESELQAYQKRREKRAASIIHSAGEVTRMQASKTFYHRFMAEMARIYPGDFIADFLCDYFSDAVMLTYLPPPKASLSGLQPFNPKQGESQKESRIKRAMLALPFLGIFYFVKTAMDVTPLIPALISMVQKGIVNWHNGSAPILFTFYNIKSLDDMLIPINVFFSPVVYGYDPVSRSQARSFLTDYGIILAILLFESVRRANILTFARLPTLFTLLGQLLGIGVVSPIYYFLYYTYTPIENFKASDMRLGRMNYAVIVLPTLLIAYYVPAFAMLYWPTLSGRDSWLFFWQLFPVWILFTSALLSMFIPDSTVSDKFNKPARDLPVIRYTIGALAALSSGLWLWTCFSLLEVNSIFNIFVPENFPADTTDYVAFAREFLKIDEISLFGNTFLWLGYLFWDMKYAGMVQTSWLRLILYLVCSTLLFGPGATAGFGWLWRENIIASTRHKDAVTKTTVVPLNGKVANGMGK